MASESLFRFSLETLLEMYSCIELYTKEVTDALGIIS